MVYVDAGQGTGIFAEIAVLMAGFMPVFLKMMRRVDNGSLFI